MTIAIARTAAAPRLTDGAAAVRAAERRAVAAHERYRRLRAAARAAAPAPPTRWRLLARIVLGTGVGCAVLVLAFAAATFVGWSPLLIVPPAAALYAVVDVTRRATRHRPCVEELATASREAAAAMAAARRAQDRARAADRPGGRHRSLVA